MPWTNHVHGGFSEVEPWLPVDTLHRELNVESQEGRSHSVLNFARKMIALRKAHPELHQGSLRLLDAPEGVLAFVRECEGRKLLCLFNMDAASKRVPLAQGAEAILSQNAQFAHGLAELDVSGFCLLRIPQED